MDLCRYILILILCCGLSAACNLNDNSVQGSISDGSSGEPNGGSDPDPEPLSCDSSITGNYGGGSGTSLDPYTICSLAQWQYLSATSSDWDKSFKLEDDISFSGVGEGDFVPVGNDTTPFTGYFDGGNNTISDVSYTGATKELALFGDTEGDVTLENIQLADFSFNTSQRFASLVLDHDQGGSVGTLTLDNITLTNFFATASASVSDVGGLVGRSGGPMVANNISISNVDLDGNSGRITRFASVLGSGMDSVDMSDVELTAYWTDNNSVTDGQSGLAASIFGEATFTNIDIDDIEINSGGDGAPLVGTLYDNLTINNASVTNLQLDSLGTTGGLFGTTVLFTGNLLTINDCFVQGSASRSEGGLGGRWEGNVVINRCGVEANMTESDGTSGFLRAAAGLGGGTVEINDSYVIGNLTGTTGGSYPSGFVQSVGTGDLTIRRSYYAGSLVILSTGAKACIFNGAGSANSVTMQDVYYDSTLCTDPQSDSGPLAGVTALATGAMQPATEFTNWLASVWEFVSGSYPVLR